MSGEKREERRGNDSWLGCCQKAAARWPRLRRKSVHCTEIQDSPLEKKIKKALAVCHSREKINIVPCVRLCSLNSNSRKIQGRGEYVEGEIGREAPSSVFLEINTFFLFLSFSDATGGARGGNAGRKLKQKRKMVGVNCRAASLQIPVRCRTFCKVNNAVHSII